MLMPKNMAEIFGCNPRTVRIFGADDDSPLQFVYNHSLTIHEKGAAVTYVGGPMVHGGHFYGQVENGFDARLLKPGFAYAVSVDGAGNVAGMGLLGETFGVDVLEIRQSPEGLPEIITTDGDNVFHLSGQAARQSAQRMGLKWRSEGQRLVAARPPKRLELYSARLFHAGTVVCEEHTPISKEMIVSFGGFGPWRANSRCRAQPAV